VSGDQGDSKRMVSPDEELVLLRISSSKDMSFTLVAAVVVASLAFLVG
jgi:hypothetical protein